VNQDVPLATDNLFAVADGMGGHAAGDVAAQVAVEELLRSFSREPTRAGLQSAFSQANQAVWRESMDHTELRGMGTTLTAAALVGGDDGRDTLALANVGDSRAYLFSEDRVVQITADHSLAEERVRFGELTEAEAAVHPQRHILTRVLGVASDVEADMWELRLRSGDRLLLCSDGLTNEVGPEVLVEVLSSVPDPGEAARQLVDIANEHGGADNITVVVVDILIGEDDAGPSVITPLGERAGGPLAVAPGGADATSVVPGPGPPGGLAGSMPGAAAGAAFGAGAALGLDDQTMVVPRVGSRAGLALDETQAVPVARTTDRTALATRPMDDAPPGETRGQRRRRLGIPRRITLRVVLFVLLVAAIPVGAYFAVRWYAYDNWYVSVQKGQIIVKQGRPGGVLWFNPRVVDHTGVTASQVLPEGVRQIHSGVQEPSLAAAKRYVSNLRRQYNTVQAQKAARTKPNTGPGPDSVTTTTLPGASTTTVPGATGTPTTAVTPTTSSTATTAAAGSTSTTTTATVATTTTLSTAATTANTATTVPSTP
jgi:protein phosphatase